MAGVVTVPERIHNLKGMLRFLRRRGDPAALWDEPWHEDLVKGFAAVCVERKGVSTQALLSIHPDDLRALYDDLKVPVDHRIVIRRYLNLPHVAIANAWTGLQILITATVVAVKVLRFAFRPVVWKVGFVVGVSALLATQGSLHRLRHILQAAEAQARQAAAVASDKKQAGDKKQ